MRFFVSCFGGADPTAATNSVVPPPSRTLRRNKTHWRPTLRSISEDTTPPGRERAVTVSGGDTKRSKSTATAATAKAHRCHNSEDCDYRRVATTAIMPAFSPTPFMF